MNEILFIRHAETNMAGTFCGDSDPELNVRGHGQVAELIEKLRAEKVGSVYTSNLRRALTTARAIADTFAVDCQVRTSLREISFGRWEGLTWKEIEQLDDAYARRWLAEHPNLPAPGGEVFHDFEQRVLKEVGFLSTKALEQSIAVVTHAGVIRTVLCSLQGYSKEEAWKQAKPFCAIVRHAIEVSPRTRPVEARL